MESHRHPSEKPLPPISVYIYVSVILTVVTAVEVAAFYLNVPGYVLVPVFIILSLFKFVLVVMFFMHLKYDHKIFSSFFTTGLLLAMGVALGLIALFNNFDIGEARVAPQPPPPPPINIVPTPSKGPDTFTGVVDGPQIFLSRGCNGCHVIDGLAGAVGVVGPNLTGVASRAGDRIPGLSAEEYIRQSIELPQSFVVDGFDNVMQPLRTSMTDLEFELLVEYLLTLQ